MSNVNRFSKQRASPATARTGDPWTSDETKELETQLTEGMGIKQIAHEHKRTEGGVFVRCKILALKSIHTQQKDIDAAAKHYQVPVADLQKSIAKKTTKQAAKAGIVVGAPTSNTLLEASVLAMMKRLEELETQVKVLTEKQNEMIEWQEEHEELHSKLPDEDFQKYLFDNLVTKVDNMKSEVEDVESRVTELEGEINGE